MVIKVIVCEICKNPSPEGKSSNPLLIHGMGRYLHKAVFAALCHHVGQQFVDLQWIRRSMGGWEPCNVDVILYGRYQPGAITKLDKETMEQGYCGRFSIGPGYTYKFQLFGRISMEIGGHDPQRLAAISGYDISNA